MPFTTDTQNRIDRIRDYLYGGGFPDPLANAEQISYLFFFYLIEGLDNDNRLQAEAYNKAYTPIFEGEWEVRNPRNADTPTLPAERMRWSVWAKAYNGEPLVRWVRDEVFPFYATIADRAALNFMEGARLSIDEPTVLSQVLTMIDGLNLGMEDADSKGDLFEYVLKQIRTAGELGQFRTPRHIIRAIVQIINPTLGESVYDPAAGTGGFLVGAYNHIRLQNSSPYARETVIVDEKPQERGFGDQLSDAAWQTLRTRTFYGNDVDPRMVRLATMNLFLRDLPDVRILKRNVLTTTLESDERANLNLPSAYDVILANPPFSGKVDKERLVDEVKVGTSTATELLFLNYMLGALRDGGRCGVVVPEGVLSGSTKAHRDLRRQLIENHSLHAVMSLPGGVFQPYSGVKTSVLFFSRGGQSERVLFLGVENDGYKLDAQHNTPIAADDLPTLIAAYHQRDTLWQQWLARREGEPWEPQWWFATRSELRANDYTLSASRYRPQHNAAIEHADPRDLLAELQTLQDEIDIGIAELLGMVEGENE